MPSGIVPSSASRFHWNRFEYKYLIDEPTARIVRDFLRPYLIRDENARPDLRGAYATHSVYLDGPGLPLYRASCDGHKNRYKLRVRYYDEEMTSPVFFEIKRRAHDTIIKERALVHRERAIQILRGRAPEPADLLKPDDLTQWHALRSFADLRDGIAATPRALVSYMREAWIRADDDHVRITFDRQLKGGRYRGKMLAARDVSCPTFVPGNDVILELKFTDRFPTFYRDLVQATNLHRGSMAKYCQVMRYLPKEG